MDNIWDYFKRLFQESEESSPSKPFIREEINRSDDEQDAFSLWKRTQCLRERTITIPLPLPFIFLEVDEVKWLRIILIF